MSFVQHYYLFGILHFYHITTAAKLSKLLMFSFASNWSSQFHICSMMITILTISLVLRICCECPEAFAKLAGYRCRYPGSWLDFASNSKSWRISRKAWKVTETLAELDVIIWHPWLSSWTLWLAWTLYGSSQSHWSTWTTGRTSQ